MYNFIMSTLPDSALKYILMALVPYTEANMQLSFSPNLFFNDLEKIDTRKHYSRKHWQNTYYRAKSANLIDTKKNQAPQLTGRGKALLDLYFPKKLQNTQLMVIFDIPEKDASKRRALRRVLKKLHFLQIQRSVWTTEYDCRSYLQSEIAWLNLERYIHIYEVKKI